MPQYVVVFDAHQATDPRWGVVGLGLLLLGVSALLFYCRKQMSEPVKTILPFGALVIGLLFTLISLGMALTAPNLVTELDQGRCDITEGIVTDFHPMPYEGHDSEWFEVNGKRFNYSDFELTGGFHNTAAHGGPMQKGLQVRVHHVGNEIAKLEIARDPAAVKK